MTGDMASYFFRNLACLIKPLIKAEETVEQLLLLTDFVVMCFLRDIIGQVATTSSHSDVTIGRIAELGKEAFSLYHLIYPGAEILPYKVALCMDLPIQLTLLLLYCKNKASMDTTDMSCCQSELLNKLLKSLVRSLSSHEHVTGVEEDITKHTKSECFRAFIHEYVVKEKSIEVGMLKLMSVDDEEAKSKRTDTQAILPGSDDCKLCGIEVSIDNTAHDFICKHPLMEDLLLTAKTQRLVGKVARLRQEESMIAAIVPTLTTLEKKESSKAKSARGGRGRGTGRGAAKAKIGVGRTVPSTQKSKTTKRAPTV